MLSEDVAGWVGPMHITVCCVLAPSLPGGPARGEHKLVRSKAKELKGNACSCRVDGAQMVCVHLCVFMCCHIP